MAAAVGVAVLVLIGVIVLTRNHPLLGPVAHASPTPTATSGQTPGLGITPATPTNAPAFTGPACAASMASVAVKVDQVGLNGQEVLTITGTVTNHTSVTCAVTQDTASLSCNPVADALDNNNSRVHWYSATLRSRPPAASRRRWCLPLASP